MVTGVASVGTTLYAAVERCACPYEDCSPKRTHSRWQILRFEQCPRDRDPASVLLRPYFVCARPLISVPVDQYTLHESTRTLAIFSSLAKSVAAPPARGILRMFVSVQMKK